MSTNIYVRCINGHPEVQQSDSVGQHTYDLPEIRRIIKNREGWLAAQNLIDSDVDGMGEINLWNWNRNALLHFMYDHSTCSYELWDEYGNQHPIIEETNEEEQAQEAAGS